MSSQTFNPIEIEADLLKHTSRLSEISKTASDVVIYLDYNSDSEASVHFRRIFSDLLYNLEQSAYAIRALHESYIEYLSSTS